MAVDTATTITEPDFEARLRDLFRMFLRQKRITNKRAAAYLGMSDSMLSERLNGPTRFTWPEIVKLADFLEVSLDVLRKDPSLLLDPQNWKSLNPLGLSLVDPPAQGRLALDFGKPVNRDHLRSVDNAPALVGATR